MSDIKDFISLPEHSYILSQLLKELPCNQHNQQEEQQEENLFSWSSASDWLDIAASIESVELNTTRFDESVQWCEPAWHYESKRSKLLAHFITRLTVFNFIWGCLETVIKIIAPGGFNYELARQIGIKGDMIDRAIYYLKMKIIPFHRIPLYDDLLADFRLLIRKHANYSKLEKQFKENEMISLAGLGIHIIRMVRNDFAHGSAQLPSPDDWGEHGASFSEAETIYLDLIEISSRIVLLTIQMLLLSYYGGQHFLVNSLKDSVNGLTYEEDIHVVARVLHLRDYNIDLSQFYLFGDNSQIV